MSVNQGKKKLNFRCNPGYVFINYFANEISFSNYNILLNFSRERLRQAYEADWKDAGSKVVAALWDAHGWIWHGYEVVGLENIPVDQPILFVYYHGAIPTDLYYFLSRVLLFHSKLIHTVADRFLFKFPGWPLISDVLKVIPGTVQTCSSILKEGNMLAISPGGVYEAQFGDSYYRLMWKKRLGFAKVALEAKVVCLSVYYRSFAKTFIIEILEKVF